MPKLLKCQSFMYKCNKPCSSKEQV
jgi:hypothetical protein